MTERTTETVQHAKEQVATIAQAIIEQAASRATSGADRAKGAAGEAKRRVYRRQKAAPEIAPTVREVALQAAAAALELWQAARERAEDVPHAISEPAAGIVAEAGQRASSAADAVVDRAGSVTNTAERRARQAADAASERASGIADKASDVSEQAKEVAKSATDTTVSAGKDTGATLLWSAAAAAIIFYALLDKDRREQVLSYLDTAVTQARELIRDFQGYDEEFV